jgi:hypothetical protein
VYKRQAWVLTTKCHVISVAHHMIQYQLDGYAQTVT